MNLYSGSAEQFIEDNEKNYIWEKMKLSFFSKFRYEPSSYEIMYWQKSLKSISKVIKKAGLKDNGILLQYKLPMTSKKIDLFVTGKDKDDKDTALIVELKDWCKSVECECDNEVVIDIAGTKKEILHPSVQLRQYKMYLQNMTDIFTNDDNIKLKGCSYLHNYNFDEDDAVLDNKFDKVRCEYPLFDKNENSKLEQYINKILPKSDNMKVMHKIEQCEGKTKKLMNNVSDIIKGKSQYILLDEQMVVYDKVFSLVKKSCESDEKKVIIIKGGPGTGKSVIAINLMADMLKEGYKTQYATGSRAFTETLRSVIGSKGASEFKYFNSYMQSEENSLDVLICDEAHRIRKSSNNRFTKKDNKSDLPQIEELIRAAKVCVFFIDDMQVVRPEEIGSSNYIKEFAKSKGVAVYEYELKAQFRCSGADGFVDWIDNTLGLKQTPNIIYDTSKSEFDFKIVSSPEELERMIREKNEERYSARMVAGFCWPWSKTPDADGNLVNDIVIGDFKRPWNAHPDIRNLKDNIPKAPKWASDENGINQIGCIYTAQGFEFDYVGVIVGKDLAYDLEEGRWKCDKEYCKDVMVKRAKDNLDSLIKNAYRVLLSRGMKGCYVWFEDEGAEEFFKSRIE